MYNLDFNQILVLLTQFFLYIVLLLNSHRVEKKLHCCFIDYKKAFDSIIRSNLWIKIKHYGIHGKLLSIIQSMYSDIKTCVKSSGNISQFFENFVGLLQGEVLSPMLFALYVNDLENVFLNEGNMPIELNTLSLFNIMYADDMVICAESASELQNMLNTLSNYCIDWGLEVNVEKTKIVVFRNAGRASNEETWSFDGKLIQVVDQFTYLGILLNFNGKFFTTQKQLASQGRKAMFALKSSVSNLSLNHCSLLSLFDTYVCSILSYGCEVWCYHKGPDIEKIHLDFLRYVLGVRRNTNRVMLYFETGRLPLHIKRIIRMFKYWFKLLQTSNCVLKAAYDFLQSECENPNFRGCNWASNIKNQLFNLGLNYMWLDQYNNLDSRVCLRIIEERLKSNFVQKTLCDMENEKSVIYTNSL